jgi:biopolymer transport protein TolR
MRRNRFTSISDINITSLVDVTMVLLIIFMLTAPFIQMGIRVQLPRTQATVIKEREGVVVTITKEGRIFLDGEEVEPGRLEEAFLHLKTAGEERVFLRADEAVPYGVVMRVIGQMKRVGIDEVGMITEAPTGEGTGKRR